MEKTLEPLNQKGFAEYLGISDRTLIRHRERIESEWGVRTTTQGGKNQIFYQPEWFPLYERVRDGKPTSPGIFCCELPEVAEPEKIQLLQKESPVKSIPTELKIYEGRHRTKGQLATMPPSADLSTLRGGVELITFDDPLAAVDQAIQFADTLLEKIESDTDLQVQQVQKTQRANAKLRSKVNQVQRRQQQYSSDSRLIALLQNGQASELQQNMEELQSLGKSDTDGSSDSAGSSQ